MALTMAPSLRNCGPRSFGARAAAVLLTALVLLFGTASASHAQSDCAGAFERWSKLSASRTRAQSVASGQEACLQSEGVRADLLQALAKARSICDAAPWSDQSVKLTKEMIDINASAISMVAVCRAEPAPAKEHPVREQPVREQPIREQPIREQPVREQPVREQPAAARAIEPEPAPTRQRVRQQVCLDVSQAAPERFVFANHKCGGRSVLVVIERKGLSGRIECKAYTIGRQLTVATLRDARPHINYECMLDEGGCTKAHVATFSGMRLVAHQVQRSTFFSRQPWFVRQCVLGCDLRGFLGRALAGEFLAELGQPLVGGLPPACSASSSRRASCVARSAAASRA